MAKNQWGLDDHYFSKKLGELSRDASHYTPEEMRRALDSLSDVARHQAGAAANTPNNTHQHSGAPV
jgi:hypothetical protein